MPRVLKILFVICGIATFCSAPVYAEILEAASTAPGALGVHLGAGTFMKSQLDVGLSPMTVFNNMELPPAGKLPLDSILEDYRLTFEQVNRSA